MRKSRKGTNNKIFGIILNSAAVDLLIQKNKRVRISAPIQKYVVHYSEYFKITVLNDTEN